MFIRFQSDDSDASYRFMTQNSWVSCVDSGLFIGEIVGSFLATFLNFAVFSFLWLTTNKEYEVCFYMIMRTFTGFTALNSIGSIIVLLGRKSMDFEGIWVQALMALNVFSYFSASVWLFYAGLNRMLVLVYPQSCKKYFECGTVRLFLIASSLLVIGFSVLYQKMCDITTKYNALTNTVQMVASSLAEPIIYLIYLFPLSSLIFYAIAYDNLRQKRSLVTSDKTLGMIDKAERKTLKIGIIIMVSYTLALVIHLIIEFGCQDMEISNLFNRLSEVVSIIPQLSLPFAIFMCNQTAVKKACRFRKPQTVSDSYNTTVTGTLTTKLEKKSSESF